MKKIIILGIVLVGIIISGILSQQGVNALLTPIQLLSPMDTYVRSVVTIAGDSGTPAFCDPGDIVLSGGHNFHTVVITNIGFNGPVDSNGDVITNENTPAAGWRVGSIFDSPVPITNYVNCAKVPILSIGGIQLETDTTALLLGYAILNSYWVAPIAIGVGLGIYLIKRKF